MTDALRPLERSGRRGRRRLSPVQKYEAFVQVLTGEMTVVECADHWGVDRSTIMRAREVAKKGALDALASSRPGTRAGGVDPELVMARDEAARLGEALKEMAVKVTLLEGKEPLGVTAGVPPRVEAGTKAALLDLVDGAVGEGWSTARACSVLELDSRRCRRWQHRSEAQAASTTTLRAAPRWRHHPMSAGRSWSFRALGRHRRRLPQALAHGAAPRTRTWSGCHASTLYRVLAAQGPFCPPAPSAHRRRRGPCRTGSNGNATRSGSTTSPTSPEPPGSPTPSSTSSPANGSPPSSPPRRPPPISVSRGRLHRRPHGHRGPVARRRGPPSRPRPATATTATKSPPLLAMSDNRPQMRAGTTREFLALCSIAARFGRPGTPTDQAWIEPCSATSKPNGPSPRGITDPNTLRAELATPDTPTTPAACTPALRLRNPSTTNRRTSRQQHPMSGGPVDAPQPGSASPHRYHPG